MSSRVFTHLFRVFLAYRILYSSQKLHMEVNTSHGYHNINSSFLFCPMGGVVSCMSLSPFHFSPCSCSSSS
jgi:hypothetical protein